MRHERSIVPLTDETIGLLQQMYWYDRRRNSPDAHLVLADEPKAKTSRSAVAILFQAAT
jgi:hypothetical protein